MSVRLFVEGGGNQKLTKTACRKAFHVFFDRLLGDGPKPRIVASGSRDEAYRDFSRSLSTDADSLALLLVDSEDPVPAGKTASAHLRDGDHWTNPLPDDQVHMMVQCMEAWFLADKTKLQDYYGAGFRGAALSASPTIEAISKKDIFNSLERATLGTSKANTTKQNMDSRSLSFSTLLWSRRNHALRLRYLLRFEHDWPEKIVQSSRKPRLGCAQCPNGDCKFEKPLEPVPASS